MQPQSGYLPTERTTLRQRCRGLVTGALIAAGALCMSGAVVAGGDEDDSSAIRLHTLSAKSWLVSGGDVLMHVSIAQHLDAANVKVTLNGKDVSSAFRPEGDGLTGLVSGLNQGRNQVRAAASAHGSVTSKTIEVTNWPLSGPITSGPHEVPFICTTAIYQIYSSVLGVNLIPDTTVFNPSTDSDCSAQTKITYLYMPKGGTNFQALPSTTTLPADMSQTTTTTGATVNFIVRFETSTIDRGIYQSAILFDPTSDPQPSWHSAPKGWNHRLVAIEGAGCPGGWYFQGTAGGSLTLPGTFDASLLSPEKLGEGYALYGNTLQNASQNCNSVLSQEAAMMGKEHFIKSFGVPVYTVSTGCSGGSYGSSMLVDALPGLFDGVLIACTFPDPLGIAFSGSDGHLLTHYFAVTNPTGFSVDQQLAVSGYKSSTPPLNPLQAFYDAANQAGRTDPVPNRADITGYVSASWSPVVPVALRYDPVTNPRGARPTVYDHGHNIYGVHPSTGFAHRPFDNVGVQYGLSALNAGAISADQFLDLNARIGGYDQDFNYVPQRVAGSLSGIKRAQEAGLQLYGGGGLASIPVFDISGIYNDDSGYHYQWYHFAMRERMREANGNTDNHVMWRGNPVPYETAWSTFIQWVEAVAADKSAHLQSEKVANDKPAAAVDGCWSDANTFIDEPQTFSRAPDSACNTLFPSFAFPRYEAGGPVAANIMKCQLKAITPSDYKVPLTTAQMAQLQQLFPSGVCDWSQRGVEQTGVIPWASFGPSPVNLIYDVTGRLDN
jgi:hypothetical protein